MIKFDGAPWACLPCAPYLDRLLEALKTKPVPRKRKEGWIVRISAKRYDEWRTTNKLPKMYLFMYVKQQVPWFEQYGITDKEKTKRSLYAACFYEFACNYEMMVSLVSIKPSARRVLFRMAPEGSMTQHIIAVADLYHLATRHLPKETEE